MKSTKNLSLKVRASLIEDKSISKIIIESLSSLEVITCVKKPALTEFCVLLKTNLVFKSCVSILFDNVNISLEFLFVINFLQNYH